MNYIIILLVFTVLGFAFGALIYFVQYKISQSKNKSEDNNSYNKN